MAQLSRLIGTFEELWPLAGAEDWDSPGLVCGNPVSEVGSVMLAVDVTRAVVDEAIDGQFDLLLAHHPFLMRGVKLLGEDSAKGATIGRSIRAGLAIYAAHTNADIVRDGVSDVLAKALGLQNLSPLVGEDAGSGRVGNLTDSMTLGEFASLVAQVLPRTATGVRVAGDYNQVIERVAVCGGAGDSFIEAAVQAGADAYLTADLRHHPVQELRERSFTEAVPALLDVSHWASEYLWLEVAAEQLRRIYPDLKVSVCDLRTDPWDFVVTQ
ncbi:MAG: hypothetical protein RL454_139 [Actinomycetota bacterium]